MVKKQSMTATATATALPPMPSRRERTRAALVAAGMALFAERAIDAVAIDEIVALAGVAKGTFFNHFDDKHDFARAIAGAVRAEVEARVAQVNAGETDPLRRLAGGMLAATGFALDHPAATTILLRTAITATGRDHPLNAGLRHDINAAQAAGVIRAEASAGGVLFWLGLCHALMMFVIDRAPARDAAAARMAQIMIMGLTGLGARERAARTCATDCAARLMATQPDR